MTISEERNKDRFQKRGTALAVPIRESIPLFRLSWLVAYHSKVLETSLPAAVYSVAAYTALGFLKTYLGVFGAGYHFHLVARC